MVTKIIKSRGPAKIVRILVDKKKIVTSDEPYKPLTIALKKRTARNSQGRITIRFRANPVHRRLYRLIDFYRLDKKNIPAKIETIEYDPNRSAFIALVCYADGERRYHLLADGLTTGNEIICGDDVEAKPGNRLPLKNINPGSEVFEIELTPNSGGKLVRSAGSAAILLGFENNYALLKMPSGEIRKIHQECYATVGRGI
ncbi:MAG: hypothetical protein KatS3mg093_063 [Candidatus Parcubacteria bacterium]|nr:MAG: hypothetical protein KatS3mg093_063 [Candidatus Parcubacteria bacterium]